MPPPQPKPKSPVTIPFEEDIPFEEEEEVQAVPGFVGGVWETVDPIEDVKFLAETFTSNPFKEGPVDNFIKGMAALSAEQWKKSQEASSISGKLLHGAATFPMMGPMAATTVERMRDPEQRARGLGNIVGLALPSGLTALGKKIRPGVKVAPGAGAFEEFRKLQQEYLSGFGDNIIRSMHRFEGTSYELGATAQLKLADDVTFIKKEAGSLYDSFESQTEPRVVTVTKQVPVKSKYPPYDTRIVQKAEQQLVGGIQPSTKPLKQQAERYLARITRQEALIPPARLEAVKTDLKAIINGPDTAPIGAFVDSRSDLLTVARDIQKGQAPSSGKRHAVTLALADKMDEATEDALRSAGRTDLLGKLRDANKLWREMFLDYEKTLLSKIETSSAEKAHRLVMAADIDDINRLRRHVSEDTFALLVSRGMRDIVDEATQGELVKRSGIGEFLNLPEKATSTLNGTVLGRKIETLARQGKLDVLVSKETKNQLIQLAEEAKQLKAQPGSILAMLINVATVSPILSAAQQGLGSINAMDFAHSAGIAMGVNLTARALTTQRGTYFFRRAVKAATNEDFQMSFWWLNRIREVAERGELENALTEEDAEAFGATQSGLGLQPQTVFPSLAPQPTPLPL
jgi:hypothetical protein